MSSTSETTENNPNQTPGNIPDELTLQLAALLRNSLGAQATGANSENLSLGIKLSEDNYSL